MWALLGAHRPFIRIWSWVGKIHRFGGKYLTAFTAGCDPQNADIPFHPGWTWVL